MASCTLDASVKIYSYRVDSIHSEAYKVLGGLGRSGRKESAGSESGDDGNDDGENQEQKKSKVSLCTVASWPICGLTQNAKTRRHVKTLETNAAALNVKKFDLEFDIDPLFKKVYLLPYEVLPLLLLSGSFIALGAHPDPGFSDIGCVR